jgi:hypothetical protein
VNLAPEDTLVALSFGLSSITPDATMQVLINGHLAWEGASFYGIRPVFISEIVLAPGRNSVSILSTGRPVGPNESDPRILSYSLYDFQICEPEISKPVQVDEDKCGKRS